MFDNEDRSRYYGIRVGDIVENKYAIEKQKFEVVEYGFMNNNSVIVRDSSGVDRRMIAEHLTVIKKTENRKAPNTIKINGKTYNKCHISKEQWDECITPCIFCHSEVQRDCSRYRNFCYAKHEHVCYIDLGAIYGEED